jgi:hypothetical protein
MYIHKGSGIMNKPDRVSTIKQTQTDLTAYFLWLCLLKHRTKLSQEIDPTVGSLKEKKCEEWSNRQTCATNNSRIISPYWLTTSLHSVLIIPSAPIAWFT